MGTRLDQGEARGGPSERPELRRGRAQGLAEPKDGSIERHDGSSALDRRNSRQQHLHHRLLEMGHSQRRAVLLLTGFAVLLAVL